MQILVTPDEIRSLESTWIKSHDSNLSLVLMDRAGSALANVAKDFSDPYLILCGKGNNAGDGMVAARLLHEEGKKVILLLTSNDTVLSSDTKINYDLIKDKVSIIRIQTGQEKDFLSTLNNSNTIIDCLLGTGSVKKLSPLYEEIINRVNSVNKSTIACDVPTGVNSANGSVETVAFKANITVTFGYAKIGLVVYPAKKYVGKIKTINIGLPEAETNYFLLDDSFLKSNFPKRNIDANKGNFGRTLLVCGSAKYPGAALLASKAAASIGSGITSLSSPKEAFDQITSDIPEITHVEFNVSRILEESLKSSALVIGPGLTSEEHIKHMIELLITKSNIPIILDADGINVLSGNKEILVKAKNEVIITPHPKELARLLDIRVEEVLKDKIELVTSIAKELKVIVVLKGPATLTASPDGKLFVSPFANSALAKGGTGDVLAGFIGGLVAQGLQPHLAACTGVYIHGKSAECVTKDKTVFSLLPQDLITYLPQAIKSFGL